MSVGDCDRMMDVELNFIWRSLAYWDMRFADVCVNSNGWFRYVDSRRNHFGSLLTRVTPCHMALRIIWLLNWMFEPLAISMLEEPVYTFLQSQIAT